MTCCLCKKEIMNYRKYFVLFIKEKKTNETTLKLRFDSYKCLKQVINEPGIIIMELL